jgi:RNA polymerase sigma-70 factor (ECF subfamily)
MTDSPGAGHKPGTGLALPAQQSRIEPAAPSTAEGELRFEEVFRSCFDYVWRGLRRLGVPESSVDDALQDVFLVVHRRRADFQGRSSVKTWIYGIVLRVAHDHRRARKRRGEAVPLEETLPDGRPGPQEAASHSEALRLLEELLAPMDEEKRDVLVLADMEGLTAPEIALVAGVPINTVYSRLRAARRFLDEAVARHERERR